MTTKTITGLVMIGMISATVLYGSARDLNLPGVNRGYAPEQPIAFSHRLHSGDLGISCRYCHAGAEKSRVAGVPAAGTCMKCHSRVTSAFSERERVGRSGDSTDRPARVSPELSKLYESVGFDPAKLEYAEDRSKKPIEWVKVHHLPDFVRFDHRPHVHAGIECQRCHGPVESMERIEQWSDLTMGWCVNCHRGVTQGRIAGIEQRSTSTDCSVCHY
ncbi:MAG: hypothetical protein HYR85_28130 [Planctomycetes bacterium]|nr:hypothetical protein [Planctomycetota bacterium]MBI3848466.1 hypothetical protein [Planctomycetota bacterium]